MAYNKQEITRELPTHYCIDDQQWLDLMMQPLDDKTRSGVCEAYAKVYVQHIELEPVPHKRINTARRAANIRLREYMRKKQKLYK